MRITIRKLLFGAVIAGLLGVGTTIATTGRAGASSGFMLETEYYSDPALTNLVGGRARGCGVSMQWGIVTQHQRQWSEPC